MVNMSLSSEIRNGIGAGQCHRLREKGMIPCVVYGGKNHSAIPIQVEKKELEGIVSKHGNNALIDLETSNGVKKVLIKEVQRHPVDHTIIHVDFYEVSANQKITAAIPIILKGRDRVEKGGIVLETHAKEIEIECLPNNIPSSIEVDVSSMHIGKPLKVADIEMAGEISILNNLDQVIASLTYTKNNEETPTEQLSSNI